MGSYIGGFLGAGNSSAKTDRGNQLAGVNADWNVYNRGLPLSDTQASGGQSNQQQGLSGLDAVKNYWKNILSGNKPAVQQAAAPATNAITAQADAAKAQQAQMGTSRGGGANAADQQIASNSMAQVNNTIAGLQPQAAGGLQSTAKDITSTGNTQLQQALSALGLSDSAASEIVNSSIQSRPISENANNEVRQQWSNFISALGL